MNLQRIFYLEHPFKTLSAGELDALFVAYNTIIRSQAAIFYWLKTLDAQCVVSTFYHRSMKRYQGKELVLVEQDRVSYYRLPGAKVGGRGNVAPGHFRVKFESYAGDTLYLHIDKNLYGNLCVVDITTTVDSKQHDNYHFLLRHDLEPSKFADEMKLTVLKGLEWCYQTCLTGSSQSKIMLKKIAPSLSGLSQDIDAMLENFSQNYVSIQQ